MCDTVTDAGGEICLFEASSNKGETRNDTQPWTVRSYRPLRTRGALGRFGRNGHNRYLGIFGSHFRRHRLRQLLPNLPRIRPQDLPGLLIRRLLWALGLVAAIAVAFLIATAAAFAETPVLSAPEAAAKMTSGDMVILDIRSPEEWDESGIADGAWPVSMHDDDFPKRLRAIFAQHAPDRIGLICATGGRSAYITEILAKNGITGVVDVSEGMFGNERGSGWIARGLPIVSLDEALKQFNAVVETWE